MTPVVSQFFFSWKENDSCQLWLWYFKMFAEPFKKKYDHVQIPTAIKIRVMGFSLRFWNLELDIILFKVYLRKEDIVSCHATTCVKTVKEMQVFPCVCIISAEPFFPHKSGLMINSTHAWSLLKHLTRYMRFRLKGNSSVILMIKTWKGEGYKDLGGSLSSWRSID